MSMTENVSASILMVCLTLGYGAHPRARRSVAAPASSQHIRALGGNGTGKSTTLAALLNFVRAQAGTITVAGADLGADPDAARRRIGFVAIAGQPGALVMPLTVIALGHAAYLALWVMRMCRFDG
jgi:ABC-type branched-subunit amino acid transport system ATPase component